LFDSAGVGRTGTFIALDFLTEQGKAMGYIDVLGTITAFRSQRVCLVQTLVWKLYVHILQLYLVEITERKNDFELLLLDC
jgi:protein tyrosine phosphatase